MLVGYLYIYGRWRFGFRECMAICAEQGGIDYEPCTRAVLPNHHEREGRWWREKQTAKACGLHASNQIQSKKLILDLRRIYEQQM